MAKMVRNFREDFDSLKNRIADGILNGSVSASLEDSRDIRRGDARCSVQVFERFSWLGGNRLTLTVVLFQSGDEPVELTAITSGGSQAMFWKVNTFGEEAFLDKLRQIL